MASRPSSYVAASYGHDPHVALAFRRAEKVDGVRLSEPVYIRRDGLHIWRAVVDETRREDQQS